jgi:hypothetical protein
MSFFRHEEIYPCGEGNSVETKRGADTGRKGAILADRAPAHRNDESPAGYSLGRRGDLSSSAHLRFTSRRHHVTAKS